MKASRSWILVSKSYLHPMRYLLHLAYDGFSFSGWQRQINTDNTVQQILEDTLSEITGIEITTIGCGRTDAGVHAAQYIAHFDFPEQLSKDFVLICNHRLPPTIAVFDCIQVGENWHARYAAIERHYDYFLHLDKDPYLEGRSAYYPDLRLNILAIHDAISLLIGLRDFRNLCLQPDKHNHTLCHVKRAQLTTSTDGRRLQFHFAANRFLRGMIRILVAKLIDVGIGKITVDTFREYIELKQEREHNDMAYPQGLYLSKVIYPDLDFSMKSVGFRLMSG